MSSDFQTILLRINVKNITFFCFFIILKIDDKSNSFPVSLIAIKDTLNCYQFIEKMNCY